MSDPRPHRGDQEEVLGQSLLGRLYKIQMHGEGSAVAVFGARLKSTRFPP